MSPSFPQSHNPKISYSHNLTPSAHSAFKLPRTSLSPTNDINANCASMTEMKMAKTFRLPNSLSPSSESKRMPGVRHLALPGVRLSCLVSGFWLLGVRPPVWCLCLVSGSLHFPNYHFSCGGQLRKNWSKIANFIFSRIMVKIKFSYRSMLPCSILRYDKHIYKRYFR